MFVSVVEGQHGEVAEEWTQRTPVRRCRRWDLTEGSVDRMRPPLTPFMVVCSVLVKSQYTALSKLMLSYLKFSTISASWLLMIMGSLTFFVILTSRRSLSVHNCIK